MTRLAYATLILFASLALASSAASAKPHRKKPHAPALKCRGDGQTPKPIGNVKSLTNGTVVPNGLFGYYVAPKGKPKGLVVFSHGHTASPIQWFPQLTRAASRDGVIAVAMYYPGA